MSDTEDKTLFPALAQAAADEAPLAPVAPDTPVAGADADDADDALDALAALVSNDDAHEVDDPDPATLTSQMPPLDSPSAAEEPSAPQDGDAAAAPAKDAGATSEIDAVELAALMTDASPSQTLPFAPVKPTARTSAPATERVSGAAKGTGSLAWGSRTDVGRVRNHNEDSFVIRFPLFAVADGMGGHAAGEVASTIAVSTLAAAGPDTPDSVALGAAIEQANRAVLEGAANGTGRPGMGTTCTAVVIDGARMAVGHVGDSRCYLLHAGQLVRVTHDHSYVEELVAAGEITPEEARIHPNRSIITRALGSDPAMRADHFMVELSRGDRVLLCSDGLSSMVTDAAIEETMVCSLAPQACADALVDLALAAGGHDNVTCVVVDVKDDGTAARALRTRVRNVAIGLALVAIVLLAAWISLFGIAQRSWYLADSNGYVALYRGIPGAPSGLGINELQEVTTVEVAKLSDAVGQRLEAGLQFASEGEARATLDDYRVQIAQDQAAHDADTQRVATGKAAADATVAAAALTPAAPAEPAGEAAPADADPQDGDAASAGEGA